MHHAGPNEDEEESEEELESEKDTVCYFCFPFMRKGKVRKKMCCSSNRVVLFASVVYRES